MYVELVVIRHDLSIVKKFGAPLVIIKTDSLEAVHLISKDNETTHALGVLIDDISQKVVI